MESSIVFVSSLPTEVVQAVLDRLAERRNSSSWSISNKYYSADVQLRTEREASSAKGAPAVVLLADQAGSPESLRATLSSLAVVQDFDVALLARLHHGYATTAGEIEEWDSFASEHGFEFIPVDTSWDGAEEDDMDGIGRLRNALQAHPWPQSSTQKSNGHDSNGHTLETSGFDDDFTPFQSAPADQPHFATGDIGVVFSQLQAMRAKAELITDPEERRDFAEKIALAFEAQMSGFDSDGQESA